MQELPLVCSRLRPRVLLPIFLVLLTISAQAEVRLLRRISLGPAPHWSVSDFWWTFDREAMALTPTGDVLVFSARRNGNWELYRTRGWNAEGASVERLTLDGYFTTRDEKDLEQLTIDLFVTKDGAYAICVGDAWWLKRVHGKAVGNSRADNIVAVVDLATFKVANKIHTKDLHLFDEFQEVRLDANGRIVVIGSPLGHSLRRAFIQLAIPSLALGEKCEYNSVPDNTAKIHFVAVTQESCQKALGPVSLENYVEPKPPINPDPPFKCTGAAADYCAQPYEFTGDQRFGLGVRTEGHDVLFGVWVETRAVAVIFSTKTRSEIAELDLDKNRDTGPVLENKDNGVYLLLLRNSTELSIYEVSDSERLPANDVTRH